VIVLQVNRTVSRDFPVQTVEQEEPVERVEPETQAAMQIVLFLRLRPTGAHIPSSPKADKGERAAQVDRVDLGARLLRADAVDTVLTALAHPATAALEAREDAVAEVEPGVRVELAALVVAAGPSP